MPLECDINIVINGPFWVEVANQEHPFTAMLISHSRGTCLIVNVLSLFRYGPRPSGGPDIGPSPIYSKFEYQQDDWEVHRDNVSWGQNFH